MSSNANALVKRALLVLAFGHRSKGALIFGTNRLTLSSSSSSSSWVHHHRRDHHDGSKVSSYPYGRGFFSSTASTSTSTTSSSVVGDTPAELPSFRSEAEYIDYIRTVSAMPEGFATGTAEGTFVSVEAPSMGELPIRGTVIHLTDGPTKNWAAVFTRNRFPGAPVIVGRSRLESGGPLHALVINNKVSNVCSGGGDGGGDGDGGVADAESVCRAVAEALDLPGGARSVLPSSTGVIGWRLPSKELANDVIPKAIENLQTETVLDAARAICTTDRFPKVRSITLSNGSRIVGIAKGAGMIEPNMATMLSYILTDATVERDVLQSLLAECVDTSFNSISVDGDESTSDTVVLVSSNRKPALEDLDEFGRALRQVCDGLASDIVRNGEGTSHVMRVSIENFPGTDRDARRLGRHIVNSPLFKCAVNGNDPNVGRLAGAIGSFMGKFKEDEEGGGGSPPSWVEDMSCTIGGRIIFTKGKFVIEGDDVERELSDHMKQAQFGDATEFPEHQKFVEIGVDFGGNHGAGNGRAVVLGSDLTDEYVKINADYRS